jgi:hypothetical protein
VFRKSSYLVVFVLVLVLSGNASADVSWNNGSGDGRWGNGENWGTGEIPRVNVDGYARIFLDEGPTIYPGESFEVDGIHLADSGTGGTLTMRGGELFVRGGFNCGWRGQGTLNIHDGTITVDGGTFKIARDPGSVGHVNLNGGVLQGDDMNMREKLGQDPNIIGTMSVNGGVMIMDGDDTERIQGYIDSGWIYAYNGIGTLSLEYNIENPGQTTLSATHPFNPSPANRSIVPPGVVELSWTTYLDPCEPGQPILYDVYITDNLDALLDFTDPDSILVVSQQAVSSAVVQTQTKTKYYWAVDSYIGSDNDPVLGPIFTFTADNAPPSVNAGADINTFLQDGTRSGPLNPVVTDDGFVNPELALMWTVLEQPSDEDPSIPGIVIDDPTAADTTVTVSALGTYVLRLTADDGEYSSSDDVAIFVHDDPWD